VRFSSKKSFSKESNRYIKLFQQQRTFSRVSTSKKHTTTHTHTPIPNYFLVFFLLLSFVEKEVEYQVALCRQPTLRQQQQQKSVP